MPIWRPPDNSRLQPTEPAPCGPVGGLGLVLARFSAAEAPCRYADDCLGVET